MYFPLKIIVKNNYLKILQKESNEEYTNKNLLSSSEYLSNEINSKGITSRDQQNLSEDSCEFSIKTSQFFKNSLENCDF